MTDILCAVFAADGFFPLFSLQSMETSTRVAILAIITESTEAAGAINELLHEHEQRIVGRMGLPYRSRGVSIISVVIEAGVDEINTLAGKLGRLPGVTAKAVYGTR